MARALRPRSSPNPSAQFGIGKNPPIRDPYMDGTPGDWGNLPELSGGLLFKEIGTLGLRQFTGWLREEFLRALVGREAARVYREMYDNSAVISAMLFAISQSMRKINWRTEAADDTPDAQEAADFAETIRTDMSHTWDELVVEALSMLHFGYAPHEIVYKKRDGTVERTEWEPGLNNGPPNLTIKSGSKFDDGLIGIARLPLRGQETTLRWYFDVNGQVLGLQQQPWLGPLISIPYEKLLLFRAMHYKNNPEGRSIIRSAYRPYYFIKRLEEQEAIMFERLSGLPVLKVPNALLEAAKTDGNAAAALNALKKIVTNVRIDEQMGVILPSDTWQGPNGPTNVPMYEFELLTPRSTSLHVSSDVMIKRYNLDILKTVLADFIDLGHQARGTQNLAINKVDMFYQAVEGWLNSMASVFNRYLIPRLWMLNGLDRDIMPRYVPDLAQRVDLDVLSNFVLRLAQAGARMFPDTDLENFLRDSAGLPEINEDLYEPGEAADVKGGVVDKPESDSSPGTASSSTADKSGDRSTTSPKSRPSTNTAGSAVAKMVLEELLPQQIKKDTRPYRVITREAA